MTDFPMVVAVVVDDRGCVQGTAVDADSEMYGGYTLADSQAHRAKESVVREVLENHCTQHFLKAIPIATQHTLFNNLLRAGWKMETKYLNHDQEPV